MNALGIEISDFGFTAAIVRDNAAPAVLLPNGGETWPAFVSWDGRGFVLGREAERRSRLHPRWTSHTFWEHLSLAPADLSDLARAPAYSELAYLFLKAFWEAVLAEVPAPDSVAIAVPGQFLPPHDTESTRTGLILGMARDLKLPLSALCGLSTASFHQLAATSSATSHFLYLDMHLHSAAMTLLGTEPDGSLARRQHVRMPRSGYVPLLHGLVRSMGNRFLRATAFDVTSQRSVEQAFYDQLRGHLLESDHTSDCRYTFEANGRIHQAAFSRETLLRDLRPTEEGWADTAAKFLREAHVTPTDVTAVCSARTRVLPSLADALTARGIHHVLRLQPGAAACGAARIAASRPVCKELSDVPVVSRVTAPVAMPEHPGLQLAHFPAQSRRPGLSPSHVVIEGLAYLLDALPEDLHCSANGSPAPLAPLSRLGPASLKLSRQDGDWFIAATSAAGMIRLSPGDRVRLRVGVEEVELLFAAECQPGSP
jgi:hypothetical protein